MRRVESEGSQVIVTLSSLQSGLKTGEITWTA